MRERMETPYEAFKKTWDELPDDQRADFVKTFGVDLREMLSA